MEVITRVFISQADAEYYPGTPSFSSIDPSHCGLFPLISSCPSACLQLVFSPQLLHLHIFACRPPPQHDAWNLRCEVLHFLLLNFVPNRDPPLMALSRWFSQQLASVRLLIIHTIHHDVHERLDIQVVIWKDPDHSHGDPPLN